MILRIVVLLIGYCCGLFPSGLIVGRLNRTDLRSQGSGNTGATNALRVMGLKGGLLVFLGDFLKCFIYCMVLKLGFAHVFGDMTIPLVMWGGLGVILGHSYPFYSGFKGGKGVACVCAVGFAFDWRVTVIALLVFAAVVAITKYVSLGSMLALCATLVSLAVFIALGISRFPQEHMLECYLLMVAVTLLIVFAHRSNIKRLIAGNENKISSHHKEKEKAGS